MLHCKMTHSSKGGHMLTIALGFLLGTLALLVATAIEG